MSKVQYLLQLLKENLTFNTNTVGNRNNTNRNFILKLIRALQSIYISVFLIDYTNKSKQGNSKNNKHSLFRFSECKYIIFLNAFSAYES